VDCAANCHAKGCHLLCHDDVIGTRKVSYIIYLTDPEPTWEDRDGGRLELYEAEVDSNNDKTAKSSSGCCVPGALPVKTILPVFNSMAYFVVEPGKSFHSVQEVFCDRPRLSIQGETTLIWQYYYTLRYVQHHIYLSRMVPCKGMSG
jgi:Rps23 Pro-64 3,4-dihydroxylase Tpa1-like proline 4-hydroxylase